MSVKAKFYATLDIPYLCIRNFWVKKGSVLIYKYTINISSCINKFKKLLGTDIDRQKKKIEFKWTYTNYIYIYIYSHPQTDLFRSIRTHQWGKAVSSRSWDRNQVATNVKPKLLTIQPRGDISCEVNFKRLWITITIVYIHPFNIYIYIYFNQTT